MYVNFTVSDNVFRGNIHLCNRQPRMLMVNLEAASMDAEISHKIQGLTQKIWIPMRLAQSLVEIWAAEDPPWGSQDCQGVAYQLWPGLWTCASTDVHWAESAWVEKRQTAMDKPSEHHPGPWASSWLCDQLCGLGPDASHSSLGFLTGKTKLLNLICSRILSRSPTL